MFLVPLLTAFRLIATALAVSAILIVPMADAQHFEEVAEISDLELPVNSTVLLKASRSVKLEELLKIL